MSEKELNANNLPEISQEISTAEAEKSHITPDSQLNNTSPDVEKPKRTTRKKASGEAATADTEPKKRTTRKKAEGEAAATDAEPKKRTTRKKAEGEAAATDAEPKKRTTRKKTEGEAAATDAEPKKRTTRKKADSVADTAPTEETQAQESEKKAETEADVTEVIADTEQAPEEAHAEILPKSAPENAEAPREEPDGEETESGEVGEFVAFFTGANSDDGDLKPDDEASPLDEDEEKILPPDEIFAYMAKKDTPQAEEAYTAPAEEQDFSDENVDDDGQYRLSELEPEKDEDIPEKIIEPEPPKYDKKNPRFIDSIFDFVELFVFTLLAVIVITSFFFKHSVVQGPSMENTLHNGEHLIISDFLYTPKRGDVVVCDYRTPYIPYPIVKRVIGVAGDHIKITAEGEFGKVYVNGRELDEDYVSIHFTDTDIDDTSYKYTPYETYVPEGKVFVMGDHRNDSADSRDEVRLGMVSVDSILGKVLFRFYPFDKFGTIEQGIKYAD